MTVVAAGVVSALPSLPSVISTAETEAPAAEEEVGAGESLSAPLMAQVKNLQTGEVSLYSGDQEINVLDRGLAARLFNATKGPLSR
jgi:hypothetical protein